MPYKDIDKRREYIRNYNREYMRGHAEYRIKAEQNRSNEIKQWKEDLFLDYKLRRINKHYGPDGLKAFERDSFCCTICHEFDIRVLVIHHIDRDRTNNNESNLLTLCNNCHHKLHFLSKNTEVNQGMLDSHFLRIAEYYGSHAKCYSRHIGAVIVDYKSQDNPVIVSIGRNGPPSKIAHCHTRNPNQEEVCPRKLLGFKSGEGLHLCPAAHAERNAIVNAASCGIGTEGTTLYINTNIPCLECAKSIINSGISEVVVQSLESYESVPITGKQLLTEGGVIIRAYPID